MKRLLIADDDPAIRLLVAATLSGQDCEILEAENGAQALHLACSAHPDLAVLDVDMPGMDGVNLCTHLRADPRLAGLGVLMLSATARPDDVSRAIAAGADRYLTKPFSPIELLLAIEGLFFSGGATAGDVPPGRAATHGPRPACGPMPRVFA